MGTRGKLPKQQLPVATAMPMAKEDEARERRWRAESALETLTRAEEHKKDKALMKDVKAIAKERRDNASKFC